MVRKIFLDDRIFVAGAYGMVGSAICRALLRNGYGKEKLGGALLTPPRSELNLSDNESVKQWFGLHKPSVVIIAAAKVGGIYANSTKPADFLLENIKIQTNVIESAWQFGVRRLLFLGSSCIYPKFSQQPIKEESLLNGPLENTNEWYAIAKICGIKLCQSLRIQYNFDSICLMPTNLYGPGDNYHPTQSHVLPSLIRRFCEAAKSKSKSVTCWGTGSPLREFLHVDDLGEATIFALEHWNPADNNAPLDDEGNPLIYLNVGTGKDISIKELASKVAEITGYSGQIIWDKSKPDGTPKKQLDVSRINNLGWIAKISLTKGIQNTIDLFLNTK
tara:strand:+ start:771 stop:1766 length:996 start_codon:yes stop_codon:yes gene_type:complete